MRLRRINKKRLHRWKRKYLSVYISGRILADQALFKYLSLSIISGSHLTPLKGNVSSQLNTVILTGFIRVNNITETLV
jgi:hypothetical protein